MRDVAGEKGGAQRDDTVSSTIIVDGLPAWKRLFPGFFCRCGLRRVANPHAVLR